MRRRPGHGANRINIIQGGSHTGFSQAVTRSSVVLSPHEVLQTSGYWLLGALHSTAH